MAVSKSKKASPHTLSSSSGLNARLTHGVHIIAPRSLSRHPVLIQILCIVMTCYRKNIYYYDNKPVFHIAGARVRFFHLFHLFHIVKLSRRPMSCVPPSFASWVSLLKYCDQCTPKIRVTPRGLVHCRTTERGFVNLRSEWNTRCSMSHEIWHASHMSVFF